MTVKALKKKNNMSGPFKMKGSPMARNFGIGASPVRDDKFANRDATVSERTSSLPEERGTPESGNADSVTQSKSSKTSYKQAWNNMSDTQKSKHGSFANFKAAAEKYNKKNA